MTTGPAAIFVDVLLVVWLAYGGWITIRTWRRDNQDRASGMLLGLGILMPFVIRFFLRRAGVGLLGPVLAAALGWLGAIIMLGGIVIWTRAISTLGELFTVSVAFRDDHHLVDSGPFAHVRHPTYTGMLTVLLGYGVASGDWLVALVFLVIPLAAFLYRISVEENALVQRFGGAYVEYMGRTKRLIPFVY